MRVTVPAIWWRWLLMIGLLGALFGILMVGAPGLLRAFNAAVYNSFFAGDRYTTLPAAELAFQTWVYGVLGATMAGWCLTIAFLARFPFRAGERWSWQALVLAVLVWYALDTGTSLWHGVLFNVLFNTALLIGFGVPLLATARPFLGGGTHGQRAA